MNNLRYLVIHLSLIVGLILMMLPLPDWAQTYRPHWVALMLIYWSMALPKRVGLWFAFFTGLVVDASQGTLLGQHAVGLIIITYINLNLYQRIRVLALIQQAIYVFVLLLINQLVITWTEGVLGNPVPLSAIFASPFIGMLIWPWVYIVLRDLRRKAMLS
ncbi:MAG: rod shape-determining protein MreD [Gammaproteobacteria bacterium]|jgi:rod shape-determining protein MreD